MENEIQLTPGSRVSHKGKVYVICNVIDLDSVMVKDEETTEPRRLFIKDLAAPPAEQEEHTKHPDITVVSDEDWQTANKRFEIIRPLVSDAGRTFSMVTARAKETGVHKATLYRWIKKYEDQRVLSSLLPEDRDGGRYKSRLPKEVEVIIEATINDFYLTQQKKSVQKTCDEAIRRCRNAKVEIPHPSTVRRRISVVSERVKLERRENAKAAREKYNNTKGEFPGADWPLAVIQIDHTKLDIELVDDLDRRPIGRPYITVAIDVFSRMVAGFYISLEAPSFLSVGLCIANAILSKEKLLAKYDIVTPWPIWGKPRKIHLDNAAEFRSEMLKRACQQYFIDIEWRPVTKPQYGGHIESLMDTFATEIHTLPGTTFSNITEKGSYDSEGKATFTISELERWLAVYIVEVYHQRKHSQLGCSPISKYEKGIFGDKKTPGVGLPARIVDEQRLKLDFMPSFERSVQKYGVVLDEIHYYQQVLSPWIGALQPGTGRKRKFLFKRDPRDISMLYFYDPELKDYFEIPYRNNTRPPITLWELKEAQKRLKEEGTKDIDEEVIFRAYERMRTIEEESVTKTKRMRRKSQSKRLYWEGKNELPSGYGKQEQQDPPMEDIAKDITPFDEMEELE